MHWRLTLFFLVLSLLTLGWLVRVLEPNDWTTLSLGPLALAESEKNVSKLEVPVAVGEDKSGEEKKREEALLLREKEIGDREKLLNEKAAEYEKALADMRQKTQELDAEQAKKLDRLREVYEKMESKRAAAILNDLDVQLTSQILGKMKESRAADILEKMDAEKARLVTEQTLKWKGPSKSTSEQLVARPLGNDH